MDKVRNVSSIQYWHNGCNHSSEDYVGSFEIEKWSQELNAISRYDVHFCLSGINQNEVCIRYGNDSHQYIGTGNIGNLVRAVCDGIVYRQALIMILEKHFPVINA